MGIEIVEADCINLPGAYRIDEQVYHRDPCPTPSISSSLGKTLLATSPEQAWWEHFRLNPEWTPRPAKKMMELGSACHKLLLGEGPDLAILEFDNYGKKAAQEERNSARFIGSIPILAKDHERAKKMVAKAQKRLGKLSPVGGDAEVTVAGEIAEGVWARIRLDWWSPDRLKVIDYKTTGLRVSPRTYPNQISRMGYDFQAAFYMKVIEAVYPHLAGKLTFIFMAQEWDPVYGIMSYHLGEGDISVAARQVDAAVELWSECLRRNQWPGYPPGLHLAAMPTWHAKEWLDREMEEAEGMGPDWEFAGRTS